MECRSGCGACCIVISISSPIPGLPEGKPAGIRCPHLAIDNKCNIFGQSNRPKVCLDLLPSMEMCGNSYEDASRYLQELEILTCPVKKEENYERN